MRLLIAGAPSKIFHLKEFGEELKKQGHEYHLVTDTDIYTGFPSRKITNWFDTKTKFKKLISNFSPDAVFVDRQVNFGKMIHQHFSFLFHKTNPDINFLIKLENLLSQNQSMSCKV